MRRIGGNNKGFTLNELLISIGILAILGVIGIPNYLNFRNRVAIDGEASKMVEFFREGLSRARSQQDGSAWAFNIVNGSDDYYELLKGGLSGTSTARSYLGANVQFTATTTNQAVLMTGGGTLNPLATTTTVGLETMNGVYGDVIVVSTNGKITRTSSYK